MSKNTEIVKSNEFVKDEWFQSMIVYIKDVLEEWSVANTELQFQFKWAKIEAMHKIGQLILDSQNQGVLLDLIVEEIAKRIEVSEREVYYCMKFAKTFPKLDKVPEGKSISWNRVKKTYLTEGGGINPEECGHAEWREEVVLICKKCGKRTMSKEE